MMDIPTPDPSREAAIEALVALPPMRAGDTERDSAALCVDTVMAVLAAHSAAVKEGDTVLYVWGMPGPDYDYGRAVNVRNGWFDIEMPPEAHGGARTIPHMRLSAPGDPITIGYCAKAAKAQAQAPRQTPDAVREALEQRKAINTILGRLLAPLVPDVVERIRIGNEACTAILAALGSRVSVNDVSDLRDFADRVMEAAADCCTDPDAGPSSQTSVSFTGEEGARIANDLHRLIDSRAGDAVRDALSEAIGALQPFADADEGDAEDEPHMAVWPTFTVGNLRRAVEAVKSGKAALSATPAPAVDAPTGGKLGWDEDGMCDDHGAFACPKCALPTAVDAVPAGEGEPCSFADCPPGLFRWNGLLCFKSEYSTKVGQPDAYCVDSGEYFWGGTSGDLEKRRNLIVKPVASAALSHGEGRK